jgi:molecular chaperone GrpE
MQGTFMSKHSQQSEDRLGPSADDDDAGDNGPLGNAVEIDLSPAAASLVKQLQTERDEAIEGRLRALADFRNYQRRAMENEQRASQSGGARVVRAILPALDHFDLSLSQNPDQMSTRQLLEAVRIVRDEFAKALASAGVERIEPTRGLSFDPNRHEALMRQPADDLPGNAVVNTMQAGYAMGDVVLRPAKVSVSPSAED